MVATELRGTRQALRSALEAQVSALRAEVERAQSDAPAPPTHAGCELCGYWDANQRRVAGHVTQCRRQAARSSALHDQASTSKTGPQAALLQE